ncbi:alpha-1,2-fucosyltransferase [Lacticaseibacillus suihuaensis]
MIYINITGGLGNQLFQYAFARSWQRRTGQRIVLNTYELDRYDRQRKIELDQFQLNSDVFFESKKLPWFVHRRNFGAKLARRISPKHFMQFFAKNENSLVWYEKEILSMPFIHTDKDIYIGGYWQAADYSINVRHELSRELRLQVPNTTNVARWLDRIQDDESSVCIHVRRGDYVGTGYEVCTVDYYLQGISFIKDKISNAHFYVFSDDRAWAKQQLGNLPGITIIDDTKSAVEDLVLMTACRNFIISNSTFSWWAQYLAVEHREYVVAPDQWYQGSKDRALYLPEWTLIPVRLQEKR